jgi:hypothetical protein
MAQEEKVSLRNTTRRPLTFRVAGRTVRMSPGERLEVPGTWLGSGEIQRFCGSGLVAAEAVGRKARGGGPEPAPEEAGPEPPKGGAKQPRTTSKPPRTGD